MKKTLEQLIQERHELVEKMKTSLAKNRMAKFDKQNVKYQKLSDLIRKARE